jgi:hypothetical protein
MPPKFTFTPPPGGAPSAGGSYSLPFGAENIPVGYSFAAHGDARAIAVTGGGPSIYSDLVVPAPGKLLRVGWNTDIGDVTTQFEIRKNAVPVDVFFLTGASGSNVLGGVPILAGDKISVYYAAGPGSLIGTVDIFIGP